MTALPAFAENIPNLGAIAARCHHVDVKSYQGQGRMDAFIAGFLSYYPGWIKTLYGIRWGFVRLLGMKQVGIPQMKGGWPEDVPMRAGEKAAFFTVEAAEPEHYWLVSATDKHLTAYLGILAVPGDGNTRMFHVITLVEYHNWAGPIYFNVIRPFHHLVVGQMSQAGLKASTAH